MWMCQSENGPNVLGREKTYACNLFYFFVVVFLLCFAFDWYTCAMSIVYEVHKPYAIHQ